MFINFGCEKTIEKFVTLKHKKSNSSPIKIRNMSGVTGDIKRLFNFKYKSRNDSITDQFNRVLMMKIMLVAAFLTGMNW